MSEEIEIKFLNIDLEETKSKLHNLQVTPEFETLFRITIFHGLSGNDREYIRVRDEGKIITLTHKLTFEGSMVAMEQEVLVSSYEDTIALFDSIGLKRKRTEEKHRIRYKLGNAHIDVDTWPGIPTYIEVEASTQDELVAACEMLNLAFTDGFAGDAHDVFRIYGIEPKDVPRMVFNEEERSKFTNNNG